MTYLCRRWWGDSPSKKDFLEASNIRHAKINCKIKSKIDYDKVAWTSLRIILLIRKDEDEKTNGSHGE